MYPNGRRVGISMRAQRLQTEKHKPDSSSSASSQSTLPTGTSTNNHHTSNEHDTNQKNTELDTTKDEQPTAFEETKKSLSDTTKEENPDQKEIYDNKEEKGDSYGSTSHSPSRTNPSTTGRSSPFSLPNRSSRLLTGSRRQDGRIPWSRTASSVGAGRPIIKGFPSRSTAVSSQDTSDKTKVSPTTNPSKHETDPVSNKPDRETNPNNPSNKEAVKISNDHEDEYLYEGSKETLERQAKDAVSTAASKTTSTAVSEAQRHVQNFENESVDREQSSTNNSSKSLPTVPQRVPILASNGRVRSPVVSRLKGLRLPNRLHPVQHRRLGSASTLDTSSFSSASSSGSSQNNPAESPLISNRETNVRSNTNVRLTPGSVSRSSHGLSAGERSSGNISPESRNPVMASRQRALAKENTPVNGYKPSYGKGKHYVVCNDAYAVCTTIPVCAQVHFYSFLHIFIFRQKWKAKSDSCKWQSILNI